jgi:hypothetical protein
MTEAAEIFFLSSKLRRKSLILFDPPPQATERLGILPHPACAKSVLYVALDLNP